MSMWEFFSEHWFLAFLALCFAYGIINTTLSIINHLIRMPTLIKHGWPTAPMDADGDIKYPEKKS